jgi:hypothetical protein
MRVFSGHHEWPLSTHSEKERPEHLKGLLAACLGGEALQHRMIGTTRAQGNEIGYTCWRIEPPICFTLPSDKGHKAVLSGDIHACAPCLPSHNLEHLCESTTLNRMFPEVTEGKITMGETIRRLAEQNGAWFC